MFFTILKKELIDTLRDRRTILMMIIIPTLIFPIIMTVFMKFTANFNKEAMTKAINIGVVNEDPNDTFEKELMKIPKNLGKRNYLQYKDTNELKRLVNQDSLQFGMYVPQNYSEINDTNSTIHIAIYHNAAELGMMERAEMFVNAITQQVKQTRYRQLNIDEMKITPLKVHYENVASEKETLGKLAGGFLPYLFIAFGFMGCMYPAIDLFTGEKERGTLETLLTTPVSRFHILIGKMLVVIISGLIAATFTMLGLFLTIEVFHVIDNPKIIEIIHQILTIKFIVLFYLILIPLIIFFAGVMVPIAVYAKTFKEAQSIIAPLNAVIVLPAMVGLMPGVELNWTTACIPIINVVLSTKELIAGTLDFSYLFLSFGIMISLAVISILFSYKQFGKESNLVS